MRIANQYRKWHHVFPKAINSGSFKWKSMCTPAVLPLSTDVIPSARELDKHYERRVWRLMLSSLDDTANGSSALLRRLVSLRLARGFQLASKTRLTDVGNGKSSTRSILMSVGTLYQHIEALSDFEMQITEYTANSHKELLPPGLELSTMHYRPRIGRVGGRRIRPIDIDLACGPAGQDWSVLDRALLDQDSVNASEHKTVMRLVLLPTELNRHDGDSDTIKSRELTDEERRIEGIQKLAQLWQRDRVFSAGDRSHQVSMKRSALPTADRDPNPLAIDFQTLDPSIVVNAQDTSSGQVTTGAEVWAPLFVESEMYHSSEFDLAHLMQQMQDAPPRGVDLRDRRWFTKTHLNCFRGDEMTSWLLSAFKDVQTRGEAVAVGNEIMERGAFNHVRGQHRFRDGNYFYQIAAPYRTSNYPDTAGMFMKSAGRSVPPTPIMEARFSPAMKAAIAKNESKGIGSPHVNATMRKQVLLSQVLQYDVDPSKSSDQQEVVELHYDRIHNPENCYHIRLSWLTTTHKLVRDAISRWSTLANSHGLTLVQVPVKEAIEQHQSHPFDRPHRVRLAYQPSHQLPTTPTISVRYSSALLNDNGHFLKAVMRKHDFVLDFESADSFSTKPNVTYSWGPLNYTMTQFVHRSGLVLAQICTDGDKVDIMLLQNRLASAKLALAGSSRSVKDIMQSVDDFCSDEGRLQKLYDEVNDSKRPATSPSSRAFMNGADIDVPPMHLPPHLLR
ncbi:vacuolar membrane-associated protein iml1 [Oleoguttula sp. CCFEE 5521]